MSDHSRGSPNEHGKLPSHGSGSDDSRPSSSNSRGSRGHGRPPTNGNGGSYGHPSSARDHRGQPSTSRDHRGHPSTSRDLRGQSSASYDSNRRSSSSNEQNRPAVSVKRGRDRSSEDGPSSRNKALRKEDGGRQEGRKRREEFVNQLVTRPEGMTNEVKIGPMGANQSPIMLKANFFRVVTPPKFSVHQYRVDFEPDSEIRGIRSRLISQHREMFGCYLYDGANIVYLMTKLPKDTTTVRSETRESAQFVVTLRWTREVRYTEGTYLQVLNLILRKAMAGLHLQLVGRNFYDAHALVNIPQHRLQIWPGYLTSIRQHEDSILLNCEMSHKVMRQDNVLQILNDCQRQGGSFKDSAIRRLVGSTVLTDYNNATYRISDIDWDQTPESTFDTRNGPVTFLAYYANKYQLHIRDRKQPLLVSRASARNIRAGQSEFILLVPELARATGITDEMRTNFQLMRDMSNSTRLSPLQRVQRLMAFNKRLHQSPESASVFTENRMQLDRQLVQFEGRKFDQEIIQFGRRSEPAGDKADWTRGLQNNIMWRSMSLTNWYFVYPKASERAARQFYKELKTVSLGLGLRINEDPQEVVLMGDRLPVYSTEIENIMRKDPQFILIVVPDNKGDRYAAIKKKTLCEEKQQVPTQVVTNRTLNSNRGLKSIATKVSIQINCKLGGLPWSVNLLLKGLMIIGFDTSHDTSNRRHSYGAMVASLNPNQEKGGHYFSAINRHENGEQLSSHFGNNIVAAVMKYVELNDSLPSRILIFRDGVGDGQIEYVKNTELADINDKIGRIYERMTDAPPRIGFVILNKKTNTRIFTAGGRNGFDNPPPGTVAADVITFPERYDFYLVSQNVTQGTVAPTYYNVIQDGFNKGRADVMQTMTYKLCHLYFNWSGTTRIPAVVQYAKKLAFLVGQSLHVIPKVTDINNQLYFL